jgi:hypothetical protein
MKEDEMGGACSTYGRYIHTNLWLGNLKGRNDTDDIGANKRTMLN